MDSKDFEVFDILAEGVQVIDKDWKYVYVNEAVSVHGKSSTEKLVGKTMMEMYSGIEKTEVFAKISECMHSKKPIELINEFHFPDGSTGWFELKILPIEDGALILSLDITEQKLAEIELKKKNGELQSKMDKVEILVKELHHRVRNNLQMILSLINLYSSKIEHQGILNAIEECKNYVHSLAMVYNSLHSSHDYTKVDLDELILKLVNHYQFESKRDIIFNYSIEKEDTVVSIDAALTYGLLLNEIIKEIISSNLQRDSDEKKTLNIVVNEKFDNFSIEICLPKHLNQDLEIKPNVFEIAQILLEQLNGEITLVQNRCMIAFDLNPYRVKPGVKLLD